MCLAVPLKITEINGNDAVGERDGITREKATEWMDKQMKQEIIAERADFIINNDGQCLLLPQISDMLRHFSL